MSSAVVWVDIPRGWKKGWPKLYDPDVDGDFRTWLKAQGADEECSHIRYWLAEEEGSNES